MQISGMLTPAGPGLQMECGYIRVPETVFDSHRYYTLIRHENGFLAACIFFELCAKTAGNYCLLGEVEENTRKVITETGKRIKSCTPWTLDYIHDLIPSFTLEEIKTGIAVLMDLELVFWDSEFPDVLAILGSSLTGVCEYYG